MALNESGAFGVRTTPTSAALPESTAVSAAKLRRMPDRVDIIADMAVFKSEEEESQT